MFEIQKRLPAMIDAAVTGGNSIMKVYAGEFDVELKDDKSPLTRADCDSHDDIERILSAADPDVPILSEEGAHAPYGERRNWEHYYLIDPLDGTKEFVKRNGEFTVNVALMERRGDYAYPVAGVVYAPVLEVLYVGIDGEGAWKKSGAPFLDSAGQPVVGDAIPGSAPLAGSPSGHAAAAPATAATVTSATAATPGDQDAASSATRPYTIVASRSHMTPETEAFLEERRRQYPDLNLVTAGSSLKICLVAEGLADEYPRFAPTMEWDTAAGDGVARAAGCSVQEWCDTAAAGPLRYNKENLRNPWFWVGRR